MFICRSVRLCFCVFVVCVCVCMCMYDEQVTQF